MEHGIVFMFVHVVVIIAVSYFVLLANAKAATQGLKIFGYVVAGLLWLSAVLILIGAGRPEFHKGPRMDRPRFEGQHMPMHKPCPVISDEGRATPPAPFSDDGGTAPAPQQKQQ